MEKLNKLLQHCKCGVYLHINTHRDNYETVEEYFSTEYLKDELQDIDSNIFQKMKEFDTIIDLQVYPNTPIGSYTIFHYDLDMALDEMFSCLNII